MIKVYSTKVLKLSFFISILINGLVFLLCIKLLSTVNHNKKSISVVVLNSDTDTLNKTTKQITQTNFKEIKPKIALSKNVPKTNHNNAILNKKTNIQTQQSTIQNTNLNSNQAIDSYNNKNDAHKTSSESQVNQDSPKLTENSHTVQNKNSTQNISPQDYAFLRKLIEKHLKYPYIARINAYEGTVVISFILEDGLFKDIHIVKSSGHSILDRSAIEAIKNIESLVKISKNVKIVIPITFKLSDS